jgi:hypothetical protein
VNLTALVAAAVGSAAVGASSRRWRLGSAGLWDAVREAVRGHFALALERERRTTMICMKAADLTGREQDEPPEPPATAPVGDTR